MRNRIYTVRMPSNGANLDIPIEGPVGPTPQVVATDGFYVEWRNRPLLVPIKAGQPGFVPLCRLGFMLAIEPASAPAVETLVEAQRRAGAGFAEAIGANTTVVIPLDLATLGLFGAPLSVALFVNDANNVGGFQYAGGPAQTTPPTTPRYISAAFRTSAVAGVVELAITNNDTVTHDVLWEVLATVTGVAQRPTALLSQSLVGDVFTAAPDTTTAGDGGLADPLGKPTIRLLGTPAVAGQLLRVHFSVYEQKDEDGNPNGGY